MNDKKYRIAISLDEEDFTHLKKISQRNGSTPQKTAESLLSSALAAKTTEMLQNHTEQETNSFLFKNLNYIMGIIGIAIACIYLILTGGNKINNDDDQTITKKYELEKTDKKSLNSIRMNTTTFDLKKNTSVYNYKDQKWGR